MKSRQLRGPKATERDEFRLFASFDVDAASLISAAGASLLPSRGRLHQRCGRSCVGLRALRIIRAIFTA